jgi:hypothetical protein
MTASGTTLTDIVVADTSGTVLTSMAQLQQFSPMGGYQLLSLKPWLILPSFWGRSALDRGGCTRPTVGYLGVYLMNEYS